MLFYRETVWLGKSALAILLVVAIIILGTTIVSLSHGGTVIPLLVVGGVFFAIWNYRAIHLSVDGQFFNASYGVFNRKRIPLENITSCTTTQAGFGRYLGIGVRRGMDGSTAYTTSFGPAVEITTTDGQHLVVSTRNPTAVCNAIQTARASRG